MNAASQEATCSSCPFFVERTVDYSQCRRGPPRPVLRTAEHSWPEVQASDSCGEHPLRQLDRLAALAMQGILAGPTSTIDMVVLHSDAVASSAYKIAHSLLAERSKWGGS